ncbi:MAG: hypothetical protein ACRCT8_18075 [Lacipirellulaceae bacterium]
MPCSNLKAVPRAAVLIVLLTMVGCAESMPPRPKIVPVTGRVFLGDEPLKFGSVMFQPTQGGQPAQGTIDGEGKFVLSTYGKADGAAVGKHQVRVSCYTSQDPSLKDKSFGDSLGDLLIPAKYNSFSQSGIEVSILAQGNAPFVLRLEPEAPAPEERALVDPAVTEPASVDPAAAEPAAGAPATDAPAEADAAAPATTDTPAEPAPTTLGEEG